MNANLTEIHDNLGLIWAPGVGDYFSGAFFGVVLSAQLQLLVRVVAQLHLLGVERGVGGGDESVRLPPSLVEGRGCIQFWRCR